MIDEVRADSGVHAHSHGDFELGPHAVRARDEHRLSPFLAVERKKRAETADTAEYAGSERAAGMVANSLLRVIRDGDIHSGIGIFHERPARFRSVLS